MIKRQILAIVVLASFFTLSSISLSAQPCNNQYLKADFTSDSANTRPDTTLPGNPLGDYLAITETNGEVRVYNSIGTLTNKPVKLDNLNPGGLSRIIAYPGSTIAENGVTVSWNSLVSWYEMQSGRIAILSSDSSLIASVEYRDAGVMTMNSIWLPGPELPVTYTLDQDQHFEITVNFSTQTFNLCISVPGQSVTCLQDYQFAEAAGDIAYLVFSTTSSDMVVDDINICPPEACADLQVKRFELVGSDTLSNCSDFGEDLTLVLRNWGSVASDSSTVQLYLSYDAELNGNEIPLDNGTLEFGAIPAWDSMSIDIPIAMSLPEIYQDGPAYIGVILDGWNSVQECIEYNNHRTIPVTLEHGSSKTIVIHDVNGNPIPNTAFNVYQVENDFPVMTETPLGEMITDASGRIDISICPGELLKIEKRLIAFPSEKHMTVWPYTIYNIDIDNARFRENTGAIEYDTMEVTQEEIVTLGHATVVIDLLVSLDWDATEVYLSSLEDNLRGMSNYLYDVSDGQVRLGSIGIYDNKENWGRADIKIHASNMEWPRSHIRGWECPAYPPFTCGGGYIYMPIQWFGDSDPTRNGTRNNHPLNLFDGIDFTTKAHELGHYFFSFYDEYLDLSGNRISHNPVYGFMESQYPSADNRSSEMSRTSVEYAAVEDQNTQQWLYNGMGCADQFKDEFDGTYDGIPVVLSQPEDYTNLDYLRGPNNSTNWLDYDTGERVVFSTNNSGTDPEPLLLQMRRITCTGIPIPGCPISIEQDLGATTRIISQGQTADDGFIRLHGFHPGDAIILGGWLSVPCFKSAVTASDSDRLWMVPSGQPFDSAGILIQEVAPINGYLPISQPVRMTGDMISIDLHYLNLPVNEPSLRVVSDDLEETLTFPFEFDGRIYSASIDPDIGSEGWLRITSFDSLKNEYAIDNRFLTGSVSPQLDASQISGPGGGSYLRLSAENGENRGVFITSSDYPPRRDGVGQTALQAGGTVSWLFTDQGDPVGDNYLSIRYANSHLGSSSRTGSLEESLKIFYWVDDDQAWVELASSVDTANNIVTASVAKAGLYAAFTTDVVYDCGDANSDQSVNVGDAVYLINYVFKGGLAPDPECAGDSNGDSDVNVGDAVYLINYVFKSGPPPVDACCP